MRRPFNLALIALLARAGGLAAQQPGHQAPHRPSPDGAGRPMMTVRMMDSLDARLDSLVLRMEASTGDQKVAAMSVVITELVAQRRTMHDYRRRRMKTMH